MPVKAGIHLRARCKAKKAWIPAPDHVRGRLYAGMTIRKSRLLVDEFRTPRLGAKGPSV